MAVGVLKLTKGKILLRNKSALTLSGQSPGNHLEKDKNSKRTKDKETEVRREIMGQQRKYMYILDIIYFVKTT